MKIILPDNPECNSSKKFTYNKEINTIDFFNESIAKINNLYEVIANFLDYEPSTFDTHINLTQTGNLDETRDKTIGVYFSWGDLNNHNFSPTSLQFKHLKSGKLNIKKFIIEKSDVNRIEKILGVKINLN